MSNFNQQIKAKDQWINDLLRAHEYLYALAVKNGLGDELPHFVEMADTAPELRCDQAKESTNEN